ncbi:hypothetical protein AVEN_205638-1 [Araneus ventricosus]|uniref:Uncharacterized protein n=1 Tax=Araneus ventricosus TaxID=182803 RepID=A0A4Y2QC25_ARAVE|nr:hypothetical protein AVEN_205638-1 [Araneus ventricosus]
MLSGGVILLYDNTHIARRTQELLKKFKWKVWRHLPYRSDFAPNLYSKILSGTRFSSDSDMKTAAENRLYGQIHHFYQSRLNKLVLRSDKSLNKSDDYVEK